MQSVAQGWLVYELTGSKIMLGTVTFVGTLPVFFTTLHAGVIADRFDKRRIVIVTQTLAMVQAGILAALALSGHIHVWHILVLSAFAGLVNAFDVPARQAMTIELVGKEDLLSAVSLNSSAFNSSRIIGPAIAGVILAVSSAGMCFLVNSISFLAIIFMLLVIHPVRSKASGSEESMVAQIREGLNYVRTNRLVLDLMIMTAVGSLFALQYSTLMPALAKNVLKAGPAGYGVLVSAAGWGALAAALSVAALGHLFKQGKIVVWGSLIVPFGLVALALSQNYHLSLFCMVVIGFGMMLFLAVSNSLIQLAPPDELRGRVLSVRTMVFMGLAPFGALLTGALAQYAGVRIAIVIGAVIFLATTIGIVITSPSLKSMDY